MVRRLRRLRSLLVCTWASGRHSAMQAGCSRRSPFTSTTQTRQRPLEVVALVPADDPDVDAEGGGGLKDGGAGGDAEFDAGDG